MIRPTEKTERLSLSTLRKMAGVLLVLGFTVMPGRADEDGETSDWSPPTFKERADERQELVQELKRYGFEDEDVLDAIAAVPRHEFVPQRSRRHAYDNRPLPIGYGQTISQPYIVAEMTRRLDLKKDDKVLEVGTGSAYQAAILTMFTQHVYSIEIVPQLAQTAAKRLDRLGYDVVETKRDDGYYGWSEHGPYDAIIVTAAAGQIPPPLIKQLKNGGRMVIPVGGPFSTQQLMFITKDEDGKVRSRSLMPVRFVPLVHGD